MKIKNIFRIFTVSIAVLLLFSCCTPDSPSDSDTAAPSTPTNLVASSITSNSFHLTWNASSDNVGVTNYIVYLNNNLAVTASATNADITGLTPNTVYTVTVKAKDAAGNLSAASSSISVTTLTLNPTAFINTSTSFEGSATATDKVLLGGSVAKGFVLDVTTAGTVKVEVLGTLTNGSPAISYYWINSTDNADINLACSTLNSTVAKTSITSQIFNINLNVGKNVICFKTARYSGLITNGGSVGLKITTSNSTFTTLSYTADSVSGNVAAVQIMKYATNNNVSVGLGQLQNFTAGVFLLRPFSDETATVIDNSLYPKIKSISFSMTTDWFTGSFSNFSSLDFTNAAGSVGSNLKLIDDNNTLFSNSNASLSSNTLTFSATSGIQITKSPFDFADVYIRANVYNTSTTDFGPASVCLLHKSMHYVGNPETWIYNPVGVRIQ